MIKLKKIFIYILLPFITIFTFLLFLNVLFLDWRYSHKSQATYQDPFDWLTYKAKFNFLKTINRFSDVLNNSPDIIGLPRENLLIGINEQSNLLSNVPHSTKVWQEGFYITDDNDVKQIQVRHRGDNPTNWLFEKKHWRFKTRKEEQFDRYRYYDYIPFDLEYYFSGIVSNEAEIISPEFNLVELYINQESQGIYIKSERINENFLRRNRIMPVNIYKGEQILSEAIVGVDNDLFGNSGVWSKVAFFNQTEPDDYSDLNYFLNTLIKSENKLTSFKSLFEIIDFNQWVKFSAYQIIAQNYHNDSYHNMRLIIDPWSGKISPIVYDPVLGPSIYSNKILNLEKSSHGLLRLLNKNSFFINEKYKTIIDLIEKDKVIDNTASLLKDLENKILISNSRDIHNLSNTFQDINWKKTIDSKKFVNFDYKNKIQLLIKNINIHKSNILKLLNSKPVGSWHDEKDGFSIKVDGYLPISNIIVNYKENVPKWIYLDINKNNSLDVNEKFTPDENGNFYFPVSLYANRLTYSNNSIGLLEPEIITNKTKFNFIVENVSMPQTINFENIFSNKNYILNYMYEDSVVSNKYNYPILNDENISKKTIKFSGINYIDKNLIINKQAIIEPGTTFLLEKKASIIFKEKVIAKGTIDHPIIFKQKNDDLWGTVALQGNNTNFSELNNIILIGGSGAIVNNIRYTSMFSLHDTKNINIKNLKISNNRNFDDAIHVVYCENIILDNINIEMAFSDALDIDMSKNIIIKNSFFLNPNNDSIDVMESDVIIESTVMSGSGDKGISVGENSDVLVYNSYLNQNDIGIAVKDRSTANIFYSDFIDNQYHIKNYQKNYQYGNGGNAKIYKSIFKGTAAIESDKKSEILVDDSSFDKKQNDIINNNQIVLTLNNSFKGDKNVINLTSDLSLEPRLKLVNKVKNLKFRGSDFFND